MHSTTHKTIVCSSVLLIGIMNFGSLKGQSSTNQPVDGGQNGRTMALYPEQSVAAAAVDSSYRSRVGDTVNVTVFDEPELAVTARIDENGRVQCALIGQIEVRGLTAAEAGERIATAYRDGYLVKPEVRVVIAEVAGEIASGKFITILGQVASPGRREIPVDQELTLLQALGLAGGPTRAAKLSKVQLKRKDNAGRESSVVVNVADILSGKQADTVMVREGDVINVPESWF
jgi:polysaccharide biosynthesis/export protein